MTSLAVQIGRFSIVGLLAAGVDYGVLHAGMALGWPPSVARIPAIAIALIVTWLLNRRLTFRTSTPPSWREFLLYVMGAGMGAAVNLAVYWAALALSAPVWLAFILGTGLAAGVTFTRYRALYRRA